MFTQKTALQYFRINHFTSSHGQVESDGWGGVKGCSFPGSPHPAIRHPWSLWHRNFHGNQQWSHWERNFIEKGKIFLLEEQMLELFKNHMSDAIKCMWEQANPHLLWIQNKIWKVQSTIFGGSPRWYIKKWQVFVVFLLFFFLRTKRNIVLRTKAQNSTMNQSQACSRGRGGSPRSPAWLGRAQYSWDAGHRKKTPTTIKRLKGFI